MKITLFGNEIIISRKIFVLTIAVILIAVALCIFGYTKVGKNDKIFIGKATAAETTAIIDSSTTTDSTTAEKQTEKNTVSDEIKIYIVGCVKNQGIVTLKKGQIINDAVNLAGGVTKDADVQNINMAYILTENAMIKIKSKKEIDLENKAVLKTQTKDNPSANGKGLEITKNSGGAVLNEITQEESKSGKIDINTATKEELDTLPRVGEKTASDIIAYREKVGGFKKIEDLMEVPRIGDKTFADLKNLIEVK